MIGQTIRNYEILEQVGIGGMGIVFRGRQLPLGRDVAIKILRGDVVAAQPEIVRRFTHEAQVLARLNHPHIATLYDFFTEANSCFMAIEYMAGDTLENRIKKTGYMSPAEALPLFRQALAGIEYAHQHGVIHRDIKPSNLMFNDEGTLKVMDFGIARALDVSGFTKLTQTGHSLGTLGYMAPEQIEGEMGKIGPATDIYSLGIVLYAMLSGHQPFISTNEFILMTMHVYQDPPTFPYNLHIPKWLEAAIMRSLAKKPEERFATVAEFRAALVEPSVVTLQKAKAGPEEIATGDETLVLPPDALPATIRALPPPPPDLSATIRATPPPPDLSATIRVIPPPPPASEASVATITALAPRPVPVTTPHPPPQTLPRPATMDIAPRRLEPLREETPATVRRLVKPLAIAAGVGLVLLLGIGALAVRWRQGQTPAGEQRLLSAPDGTTVDNSNLELPTLPKVPAVLTPTPPPAPPPSDPPPAPVAKPQTRPAPAKPPPAPAKPQPRPAAPPPKPQTPAPRPSNKPRFDQ